MIKKTKLIINRLVLVKLATTIIATLSIGLNACSNRVNNTKEIELDLYGGWKGKELTKTGSEILPKQKVKSHQNSKFSTRKKDTAKKKKINIKKNIYSGENKTNNGGFEHDPSRGPDPDRFVKGKYGHMVRR